VINFFVCVWKRKTKKRIFLNTFHFFIFSLDKKRIKMIRHTRGVTLVELVLVLVILFALVGVGITLYPDVSRRAILTGNITAGKEVANAFQLYQAYSLGGMPDNLDYLIDLKGPLTFAVLNGVDQGGPYPAGAFLENPVTLANPFGTLTASIPFEITNVGLDIPTPSSASVAGLIDPSGGTSGAAVVHYFNLKGVEEFAIHDANEAAVAPGTSGFSATFDYDSGISQTLVPGITGLGGIGGVDVGGVPGTNGDDTRIMLVGAGFMDTIFSNTDAVSLSAPDFANAVPPNARAAYAIFGVGAEAEWVHSAKCSGLLLAPIYIPNLPPKVDTLDEEDGAPFGVGVTGIYNIDPDRLYSRFMAIYRISSVRSASINGVDFTTRLLLDPCSIEKIQIDFSTITYLDPQCGGLSTLDRLLGELTDTYFMGQ
jgi:type II secretory pathway pseudopilin PulG